MLDGFIEFKEFFDKKLIKMRYNRLDTLIQEFNFLQILKDEKYDQIIIQKINESKAIAIDRYYNSDKEIIIVCFESHLIIIDRSQQLIIKTLLSRNNEDKLYFVPKSNSKQKSYFEEEIDSFTNFLQIKNNGIKSINDLWRIIVPCLSAYLIKKSYVKTDKDRVKNYNAKTTELKKFEDDDFISLRTIGASISSTVYLKYHIESGELFSIKSFNQKNDKLIIREMINYKNLNYPFLSRIYGEINSIYVDSLVIEYINGQTLWEFHKKKLNLKQKILIIIEILYSVQYLHRNDFIYRDLKPNNLIIDQNQRIVLFDFDRMIKKDEVALTKDFNTIFADPEMNKENTNPSFQNDIYSIGKLIYFIFMGEEQNSDILKKKYPAIYDIYNKCINKNANERPSISELIECFRKFFFNNDCSLFKKNFENEMELITIIDNYSLAISQNDIQSQIFLGNLYYEGIYVTQDINKAIYYYSLAANQNSPDAQLILGSIYYNGNYVQQDINKAIHYYQLASKNNNLKAQNYLGYLYYEGKYVTQDINKAIHYYSLAANQNNANAQFNLGFIYYDGKYIKQDISKAIYYYSLAAKNNYLQAQLTLGIIFFEGEFVKKDYNQSIYYFTLAANQNNLIAQYFLGVIYYDQDINKSIYYLTLSAQQNNENSLHMLGYIYYKGEYVQQNINKSIKYLTKAANLNFPDSQYFLGIIYSKNIHVSVDINKAIYYFKLAADQNHFLAQYELGIIYYEGKYIAQNVNKALEYFTLSANQNYSLSQLELGLIYYNAEYVKRDINKSIYYLSNAASQNSVEAQLLLGLIFFDGRFISKDIDKSIYYFKMAANHNNKEAQFYLGLIYLEGENIKIDINQSIFYFSLAAKQNDITSQLYLGRIYYEGKYIKRDINKYIHYFTLAANQNDSDAQYELGYIYYEGKLINRDINKAIYYFTLSANQNNSDAQFYLGLIFKDGHYVVRDMNKAIHYFTLSANLDNLYSQISLGIIYYNKKSHLKKDFDKAIYYLSLAANQNAREAQYFLGRIYLNEKCYEKAIYYFNQAANKSYSPAQLYLGYIYLLGENDHIDINKSIHYLSLANNGNFEAQYIIGNIYLCKNLFSKGIYYLNLSANHDYNNACFSLGVVYSMRECFNIEKSIHYYKLASSLNNQFAKNNLALIYKNDPKKILYAIELLKEAVKLNDEVSMYNLSHIYFYDEFESNKTKIIIDLLIKSLYNFLPSKELLGIILIKKYKIITFEIIKNEIELNQRKYNDLDDRLAKSIYEYIIKNDLNNSFKYEKEYQRIRKKDYMYNIFFQLVLTSTLMNINQNSVDENQMKKQINEEFYEGFGEL